MPSDTNAWGPAITELQDYPAIADYLNTAIALTPPLQVRGQPPRLHIYLQAAHLGVLGSLLPRLATALQSMPGSKYWDVYIFADEPREEDATPRLVHHTLIECRPRGKPHAILLPDFAPALPTLSPPAATVLTPPRVPASHETPPLQLPPLTNASSTATAVLTASPTQPATQTWRQQAVARQNSVQRRRFALGIITITGVSFALGTLASTGGAWWQSRRGMSTSFAEAPATNLEPAIAASKTATSEPGLSPAGDSIVSPSASPPIPANSIIDPMTAPTELGEAAHSLTGPTTPPAAVQLKAVGDVIPGTDFPNYRLPGDPNYLFNSVKMFMGEVDIVFGNFESTLTDYPYTAKNVSQGMTFAFRTPPHWTDVLKSAGFDVLSVANNHSFDFGDPGFEDTIANIQQSGMEAVGRKGDIVTVDANGYTVAFIGFSYWPDHNNMNDLATATALVQQAQSEADIVVISVHAGAEGTNAMRVRDRTEYFLSENRGNMVQFSRAMVDAGADLILGHGPHVPRAVELYQGRLIAYSLGNFLGYRTLSTVGPLGLSMILQVDLTETGDFRQGRVIPVALDTNGVPYIDNAFASVTLVRHLTRQDFPETPLTIDEMGYILRTDQP